MIDAQSEGMALEFNVHVGGQLKLFRIFRKKHYRDIWQRLLLQCGCSIYILRHCIWCC